VESEEKSLEMGLKIRPMTSVISMSKSRFSGVHKGPDIRGEGVARSPGVGERSELWEGTLEAGWKTEF